MCSSDLILNVSGSEFEAIVTKIPKSITKSQQNQYKAAHEAKVQACTVAQASGETVGVNMEVRLCYFLVYLHACMETVLPKGAGIRSCKRKS